MKTGRLAALLLTAGMAAGLMVAARAVTAAEAGDCQRATGPTARQPMQLVNGELIPTGPVVEVAPGACIPPGGFPPECARTRPPTQSPRDPRTGSETGPPVLAPGGPCGAPQPSCQRATGPTERQPMQLVNGRLIPVGPSIQFAAGACLPPGYPPSCAYTRPETRTAVDPRTGQPTGETVVPGGACSPAATTPATTPARPCTGLRRWSLTCLWKSEAS